MTTLIALRGLPGSGKSSFATTMLREDPTAVRVNRDDLRFSLFREQGILSSDKENLITKVQRETAEVALLAGRNVIVDDMNLRNRYLTDWHKLAQANGADFKTVEINTPVNVCVARDRVRARVVGEKVIRDIATKFLDKNGKIRPYVPAEIILPPRVKFEKAAAWNNLLPTAILIDLDGTMFDLNGRSPYDTSESILKDLPRPAVVHTALAYAWDGYPIIFMSGRKEAGRAHSETKINEFFEPKDYKLFMRADGDNRPDNIVKYELYNRHIRNKYNVRAVLDDRDQVVAMWREIGLDCFQVQPGNF